MDNIRRYNIGMEGCNYSDCECCAVADEDNNGHFVLYDDYKAAITRYEQILKWMAEERACLMEVNGSYFVDWGKDLSKGVTPIEAIEEALKAQKELK